MDARRDIVGASLSGSVFDMMQADARGRFAALSKEHHGAPVEDDLTVMSAVAELHKTICKVPERARWPDSEKRLAAEALSLFMMRHVDITSRDVVALR